MYEGQLMLKGVVATAGRHQDTLAAVEEVEEEVDEAAVRSIVAMDQQEVVQEQQEQQEVEKQQQEQQEDDQEQQEDEQEQLGLQLTPLVAPFGPRTSEHSGYG